MVANSNHQNEPTDALSHRAGETFLEGLREEGLLRPDLLKIYVAGVILGRTADRVFDAAYRPQLGISNREFESLITLYVWGSKYRKPGTLAEFLGISASGMTALVDRLEEQGLVERGPDPSDGRARLLHPTDKGIEVAQEGLQIQLEWINSTIGAALTPGQERMLKELLHDVLRVVNPGYEPPPVDQ